MFINFKINKGSNVFFEIFLKIFNIFKNILKKVLFFLFVLKLINILIKYSNIWN